MKRFLMAAIIFIAGGLASLLFGQSQSIVDTKHNLSVSGPGPTRSPSRFARSASVQEMRSSPLPCRQRIRRLRS